MVPKLNYSNMKIGKGVNDVMGGELHSLIGNFIPIQPQPNAFLTKDDRIAMYNGIMANQ